MTATAGRSRASHWRRVATRRHIVRFLSAARESILPGSPNNVRFATLTANGRQLRDAHLVLDHRGGLGAHNPGDWSVASRHATQRLSSTPPNATKTSALPGPGSWALKVPCVWRGGGSARSQGIRLSCPPDLLPAQPLFRRARFRLRPDLGTRYRRLCAGNVVAQGPRSKRHARGCRVVLLPLLLPLPSRVA